MTAYSIENSGTRTGSAAREKWNQTDIQLISWLTSAELKGRTGGGHKCVMQVDSLLDMRRSDIGAIHFYPPSEAFTCEGDIVPTHLWRVWLVYCCHLREKADPGDGNIGVGQHMGRDDHQGHCEHFHVAMIPRRNLFRLGV